jgi:hypothetical protein
MIRTLFLSLPALLFSLSLSPSLSLSTTTNGLRSGGYTYVSDVMGYINMTNDICDIHVGHSHEEGRGREEEEGK